MVGRKAAICFVLMLLLSLGNSRSIPKPIDTCTQSVSILPICLGFTCKSYCWVEAKFTKGKAIAHKCLGKKVGFYGYGWVEAKFTKGKAIDHKCLGKETTNFVENVLAARSTN
uniref:Uncharacterized protein n=1 Tax=Oryza punctata TaxID=4537 RepID=A0A0E0LSY1_ORYPU